LNIFSEEKSNTGAKSFAFIKKIHNENTNNNVSQPKNELSNIFSDMSLNPDNKNDVNKEKKNFNFIKLKENNTQSTQIKTNIPLESIFDNNMNSFNSNNKFGSISDIPTIDMTKRNLLFLIL
jgi:hypothetical protein